jgi:hypothetical protein
MLLGTLTEDLLMGAFSPIYLAYLLKEPPLEVLLADPMLTSTGDISYTIEVLLEAPIRGSIFLGYSSRKDFFFVC